MRKNDERRNIPEPMYAKPMALERVYDRPGDMLTAAEAAELKHVTLRQFRRWVKAGKVTAVCEYYGPDIGWEAVHLYRKSDVERIFRRSQWRYK